MSPTFSEDVSDYEAATTNASNKITATPTDENAVILITVNNEEVENNSSASWNTGENAVTISVANPDGTTREYHVIVTRS